MTWQCKLPLGLAILALVSGCANSPPPPPAMPQPLTPPLSAADVNSLQQHAYALGYAAGRHDQHQLDMQAGTPQPDTPAPDATAATPAVPPVQPALPPAESYSAKGPAQPVATPLN